MRILIVEDDRQLREFLKESLVFEGFVVDAEEDGERGSYVARTNDYDLVLLDNMLPRKNGSIVCQEIRGAGKSMPVIMMTVQSDLAPKLELFGNGGDDYIVKPFALPELLARVRALVRRPRTIVQDVLRVADLVMYRQQYYVERAGIAVNLTRKEFELLEYLMRNTGVTISRGMILEHVWDIHADPFSNTIETHIMNLRRKIEANGCTRLIQTIPGRGYLLTE
jgi:DNA-binding response OmpR family regulator